MNTYIVAVGSNINPEENIARARKILATDQTLLGESRFIQTRPVGLPGQSDFLNGAFYIATELDQREFKGYLKSVEDRLGRTRTPGIVQSRPIDLDIIVVNRQIIDSDYHTYDFVRQAVDEIAAAERLILFE